MVNDPDGTYEKPFSNLYDALHKGYELAAPFTNGRIKILLFKGQHYLLEGSQTYVPLKSSESSLDTSVII